MSSPPPDPQQAVAIIKRRLAAAPVQLAESLARVVRSAPPERLDRLMRTPARRVVLDGIFWQMPQYLDRRRAAGMSSSIRWKITGRADGRTDTYQLEFEDGDCQVIRGGGGSDPRVTITVDGTEFLLIATGNSDPMRAYLKGRLALTGDILLAAKLVSLFRFPGTLR